jgi:hypothetical protein
MAHRFTRAAYPTIPDACASNLDCHQPDSREAAWSVRR